VRTFMVSLLFLQVLHYIARLVKKPDLPQRSLRTAERAHSKC
jgi:hypothetical protein